MSFFTRLLFVHLFIAQALFASAPARTAVEVRLHPKSGCHGEVLVCSPVQTTKSQKLILRNVLMKIASDTLMQRDTYLEALLPEALSKACLTAQECPCDYFNRSNGWRARLENLMINTAIDTHADKNKPFSYINYSSGLLFQDILLVTKLVASGFKRITVNLVDDFYKKCLRSDDFSVHLDNQNTVNNAFYSFAKYISLLKTIWPETSITVKVFTSTQDALHDLASDPCDVLFCTDPCLPLEELQKLDPQEVALNPFLQYAQHPSFEKPCRLIEGKFQAQDYFKLVQHALKDQAYFYALVVREKTIGNQVVKERKIFCGKKCMLANHSAYLYHLTDDPHFNVVLDNLHRFSIEPQSQNGVTHTIFNPWSRSILESQKAALLRPTLEKGESLDQDAIKQLDELISIKNK